MRRAPDSVSTERLLLRRIRDEDRARLIAIRSQPDVASLLGHTSADAEAKTDWFMQTSEKNWSERGAGAWAVMLRSSGELVGHAGLWHFEAFQATGLIYGYARESWGQGIATEAGSSILGLAFDLLAMDRLIALIEASNLGSRRVAEKLGFRELGEVVHRGTPLLMHEIVATPR